MPLDSEQQQVAPHTTADAAGSAAPDAASDQAAQPATVSPESAPDAAAAPDPALSESEATSPADTVAAAPKSGPGARLFDLLALAAPLILLLCVLAECLPGFSLRGLSAPDKLLLDALNAYPAGSALFAFSGGGAPLPDISPFCLWFVQLAGLLGDVLGLPALTGLAATPQALIFGSASLALVVLLAVVWGLGFALAGGLRPAFAGCVVLLTALPLLGLTRLALPNLLFAALSLLSLLLLYQGYVRNFAPVRLILGFALAALAAFTGGWMALFLPVLTSFLFLCWRGTFRRAGARDGAIGFGVMLLLVAFWLLALLITAGNAFDALIPYQFSLWAPVWGDKAPWGCNLALVLLCGLPWLLLVPFLPWEHAAKLPAAFWHSRTDAPGLGLLWWAALSAGLLSLLGWSANTGMPLVFGALLALLAGRVVLGLSPTRSRFFFGLIGILLLLSAFLLFTACILPLVRDWLPGGDTLPACLSFILSLPGLLFLGLVCLAFGAALVLGAKKALGPGAGLLILLLFAVTLSVPFNLITLPHLQPVTAIDAPVPAAPEQSAPPETTAPSQVSPQESNTPTAPTPADPTAPTAPQHAQPQEATAM